MGKFVVGIDGGGTKTVCLLADLSGNIQGRGVSGPLNPFTVTYDEIKASLRQALRFAVESSRAENMEIVYACLGVAGARAIEEQQRMRELFSEILSAEISQLTRIYTNGSFNPASQIEVCGDTVISLVAGAGSRDGIVVIAGTGSIVYGETNGEKVAIAGGWGNLLSGEGSGYEIGRHALKAVLRAYDGRNDPTILEPMIMEYWNCATPNDLFRYVLSGKPSVKDISSLSKIVAEAAKAGDKAAIKILQNSGNELALGVSAVARSLGLNQHEFPLVLCGGVLTNNEIMEFELLETIKKYGLSARVIKLTAEPAFGAVILALQGYWKIGYQRGTEK